MRMRPRATRDSSRLLLVALAWVGRCVERGHASWSGKGECEARPSCEHCKPDDDTYARGGTRPKDFIASDGSCAHRDPGQTCPATCEEGFEAIGEDWTKQVSRSTGPPQRTVRQMDVHRAFVCDRQSLQWLGQDDNGGLHTLTCQAKDSWCDSEVADEVVIHDRDCKRRIGETCDAACKDGFEFESGGNQYTCGLDKQWTPTGHAITCVRVCPRDPEAHAGFHNGCEHAVERHCSAQCDPGYSSLAGSMTYTCAQDGLWHPDRAPLDCELHGCARKQLVPNAEYCPSAPQHGVCTTKCAVGYAGGSANFTCETDGAWKPDDGSPFRCDSIADFCVGDPEPGHIVVDREKNCSRRLQGTCAVKCESGTVPILGTDLRYKCATDGDRRDHGKWVPATTRPTCAKLCRLDEPPSSHAKFTASCAQAAQSPGAACVATCDGGYRRTSGVADYICDQYSGKWKPWNNAAPLVCSRQCAEGQEPNATDPTQCSQCPPGLHSAGEKCVDCNPGVWLAGSCQPKSRSSIDQARDWWQNQSQSTRIIEIILLVVATVGVVALGCYCCLSRQQARRGPQPADVLRESFLQAEKLPGTKLTALDIPARWNKAASLDHAMGYRCDATGSGWSTGASVPPSSSSSDAGSARFRRRAKDSDNVIHIMFSSEHVPELRPPEWMRQNLGSGAYGDVYKATWRGQEVAVKVVKLPERTLNPTQAAKAALQDKVEEIIFDFVSEVEVCADLNHPNLVRLLGYADKPRLMIVQELCTGNSLDQQLYVENWQPSHAQMLKVALDVAKGMEYLHTHYNAPDNQHTQPIIHRDLKSPNVLLVAPPTAEEEVMAKVTDFGMSRDKGLDQNFSQTAIMTGYCGSVLWMAPEILLGDSYNEKIDVYSYAMCLVEVVSGKLPWSGVATGAKIVHQVMRAARPTKQLMGTAGRPVDTQIAELIQDCWVQDAEKRPDFGLVVRRLHDIARQTGAGTHGTTVSPMGRRAGSDRTDATVATRVSGIGAAPSDAGPLFPVFEDDGMSRAASRSASPTLE